MSYGKRGYGLLRCSTGCSERFETLMEWDERMTITDARAEPSSVSRVSMISRVVLVVSAGFLVTNCASSHKMSSRGGPDAKYGVSASPRVIGDGQSVPKGGGVYRVGKPYMVAGRRYVPFEKAPGHAEVGLASWYGKDFHGRLTANGEVYDMNSISAAHRTMPMPSYARVTNTRNGHSIIVRVNDRGPFHDSRVIDLSSRTAQLLDFRGHGLARVKVEYVGRASLDGSDDRKLEATLRTNGDRAPVPTSAPTMVAAAQSNFVPQTPRAPSIIENAQPVPPLAAGMPMPLERPFDLGGNSGAVDTKPLRQVASVAPVQGVVTPRATVQASANSFSVTPPTASSRLAVPAYQPVTAPAFQSSQRIGTGIGSLY